MSDELVNLLAKKFIARPDVKAVQTLTGDGKMIYMPSGVRNRQGVYTSYHPWTRPDLHAHVEGKASYGHYLLNTNDTCKLFAFDVDLEKTGFLPTVSEVSFDDEWSKSFVEADPRSAWRDRSHPGRNWMKMQFRLIGHVLAKGITEELNIPCAVAYSGNKGIHVYGFTGLVSADEAREGAMIVLDSIGKFESTRGTNFFQHKDRDPIEGFPNLSIEVFPKQSSLDGKDLGNLMRLPLGKNIKTTDPTFFMDLCAPMNEMRPIDPVFALTTPSPWVMPGE